MDIYRARINQPSTLQPLHASHGKFCIVADDHTGNTVTLYFTEGETHSMKADRMCIDRIKISSAG